ncbi:MAG: hypothetical protein EAZ92_15275 [Candidatus Kapaibacterium sp.]|nr:MAG: hypothetical protein EAZ92_15275 [Candidatus Kapabacteria bacterium]
MEIIERVSGQIFSSLRISSSMQELCPKIRVFIAVVLHQNFAKHHKKYTRIFCANPPKDVFYAWSKGQKV